MIEKIILMIIAAIFFRLGGWGEKDIFCPLIPIKLKFPRNKILKEIISFLLDKARWCIGLAICLFTWNWIWQTVIAYAIAANVPYSEKSWIRKLIGRDTNWIIYGGLFGLSSYWRLSFGLFLINILLCAVSFWALMKLSSVDKLSHPYVELGFGALVCIL